MSLPQSSHSSCFENFITWLHHRSVSLHPSISLHQFHSSNQGNGLLATDHIPNNTILFSIPRLSFSKNSPLLTVNNSQLPSLLSQDQIIRCSKNWLLLVLVMMWERVRSKFQHTSLDNWGPYFQLMPENFDTLMFWSEDELDELKGSTILNKIGKKEAEADYENIIKPLIETRPDIFPIPDGLTWDQCYGLSIYHIMGSLILSRSFHVKFENHPEGDTLVNNDLQPYQDFDNESLDDQNTKSEIESLDEDEKEDIKDIAMVPLADLLNAKSGCENAKLFYELNVLNMTTTRDIKKGEQIYNTYGDPPNGDLLRRYGHVDDPNQFDLVEVSITTCIESAAEFFEQQGPNHSIKQLENKVEWALEMGLEEVFELPTKLERERQKLDLLPDDFICALRILLSSTEDFQSFKMKEKLPKPKLNEHVAQMAVFILQRRLAEYPNSIEVDEQLLCNFNLPERKRKAIIVRRSEKRILEDTRLSLIEKYSLNQLNSFNLNDNKKRKSTTDVFDQLNNGNVKMKKIS
ncbi:hypothetical protein O181_001490 [Austropuccinia psidii MF-1]|uniref:SET domain-containing protein n=1 Tax=Austropuccinia psidii MF-1 TaxID=1389203 RepID=A0A9Q3BB38_9BASI|nr:hypothetical protein [Austropuccinia psidii MF-1]